MMQVTVVSVTLVLNAPGCSTRAVTHAMHEALYSCCAIAAVPCSFEFVLHRDLMASTMHYMLSCGMTKPDILLSQLVLPLHHYV
jgi:hypothetical protein